MIRKCGEEDYKGVLAVINKAAIVYRGKIPDECWREPYMSMEELQEEVRDGVAFWGFYSASALVGVMGLQDKEDVMLIRHGYVLPDLQRRGLGSRLLGFLIKRSNRPFLVGTWSDADWAVSFYEKNGFKLLSKESGANLLKRFWSIPSQQIRSSVVLADKRWFKEREVL
jgi:GNAT superfamily N-acetyltransferase